MAFSPTQFSARTPLNTVKVLLIQRNISVIPTERIRPNLDIFYFSLSKND
ncbi:hypothetical protein [Kluyvera intermedia]|jgi:hypothetical protein|uniref:Uncharacterized protein n=1 Tax=Kluyvera intermedia TaxID=61648 RepID=A0ABX6DN96_KLUIN|nr:hypothetical protein [Kluyvera intermedia]QGH30069.1 hypothetical protein GHC21_10530 [Kluyvera intermedia]QGH39051.1 hypothetical protein GHC38_10530 [Kluyvera intermedia]